MEQKNTSFEVILCLLRERNHVRGLSKKIGINHMTISRKMKELTEKNVVDFKYEGKNKIYSLKKTSEARSYIYMSEQYKLVAMLNTYPDLRKIIEKIQKDSRIKLAILFGSYSKKLAKKESDVDIYFNLDNLEIKKEYESYDSKLSIKLGEYNKENNLIKEIEKNHVILKGAEEYYEKNEFFGKTS